MVWLKQRQWNLSVRKNILNKICLIETSQWNSGKSLPVCTLFIMHHHCYLSHSVIHPYTASRQSRVFGFFFFVVYALNFLHLVSCIHTHIEPSLSCSRYVCPRNSTIYVYGGTSSFFALLCFAFFLSSFSQNAFLGANFPLAIRSIIISNIHSDSCVCSRVLDCFFSCSSLLGCSIFVSLATQFSTMNECAWFLWNESWSSYRRCIACWCLYI